MITGLKESKAEAVSCLLFVAVVVVRDINRSGVDFRVERGEELVKKLRRHLLIDTKRIVTWYEQ